MTDASSPEPRRSERPPWPKIVDLLSVRRVPIEAPRHRYFRSRISAREDAVEFQVRTDRPLNLTMAQPPTMWVGDVALELTGEVGDQVYLFVAEDVDALQAGAVLSLAPPGEVVPSAAVDDGGDAATSEPGGDPVFRYEGETSS